MAGLVHDVVVPDLVEPITAWRAWRAIDKGSGGQRLMATNFSVDWGPGVENKAICVADGRSIVDPAGILRMTELHIPPMFNCGCGFYAVRMSGDLDHHFGDYVRRQMEAEAAGGCGHYPIVVGEVYLWGKVIVHEWGYRAQFAYPKTLLAQNHYLTWELAYNYRCKVEARCNWEEFWDNSMSNQSSMSQPMTTTTPLALQPGSQRMIALSPTLSSQLWR